MPSEGFAPNQSREGRRARAHTTKIDEQNNSNEGVLSFMPSGCLSLLRGHNGAMDNIGIEDTVDGGPGLFKRILTYQNNGKHVVRSCAHKPYLEHEWDETRAQ